MPTGRPKAEADLTGAPLKASRPRGCLWQCDEAPPARTASGSKHRRRSAMRWHWQAGPRRRRKTDSLAIRSRAEEQMDADDLDPATYAAILRDLARVNRLTFTTQPTLRYLARATAGVRRFR